MMPRDVYTGTSILIVGFIIINYISAEFIFEEKRLNEISENKFSENNPLYSTFGVSLVEGIVILNQKFPHTMDIISVYVASYVAYKF